MAKSKSLTLTLPTPIGQISYPYFDKPDSGRENSSNKYSGDLLIPKDVFIKDGMALKQGVLDVGRSFFNDQTLTLKDFKHPFKDTDTINKISDPAQKGCILIRARSTRKPLVVGPDKKELDLERIKSLKGGDWGRYVVWIYGYSQQGGGVTFGLNLVQFAREGAAFGGGSTQNLEFIEELEVTLDDVGDIAAANAASFL